MIELCSLSKTFNEGRSYAVRDLSLQVFSGELLVLLGSSGCGKTTTLKMINSLIEPSSGTVRIDGKDISGYDPIALRRSIGYVFQGIGLFPHMNIEANISIVLRLQGRKKPELRSRARELMALVGLSPQDYSTRFPSELSGGEQQRVGVARALAADPACLLMDEPFGALDAITRDLLQQELMQLKEQLGKTIVFVTHDIFEALRLADRIAVMHEGMVEQIGPKEEILSAPATDFVKELFERPARQLTAIQLKRCRQD